MSYPYDDTSAGPATADPIPLPPPDDPPRRSPSGGGGGGDGGGFWGFVSFLIKAAAVVGVIWWIARFLIDFSKHAR